MDWTHNHCISGQGSNPVVPNHFDTRDWFHGRQFFHRPMVGGRDGFIACHQVQLNCHLPLSHISLLMIICICSHSPALAPPPRIIRHGFPWGVCNLDPSHAQFTVGLVLLWESIATVDLTGGGAQAVIQTMGSGCKDRESFDCSPVTYILLWSLAPNRPQTNTGPWHRGLGIHALTN